MTTGTTTTVAGAITWTEDFQDLMLVTVTDARGASHHCAVPLGTPLCDSLADARRHGDGVAITVLRRGIDLDNPHDPRPSAEAVAMETTWRTPRLGDTGPWGWIDRGNVVPLEADTQLSHTQTLPLAA